MSIKQTAVKKVVGQFHRPHGFGGQVAGWVMASRGSNRKRNLWAVELLDVQPEDRVLELGFGPGVAIEALAARASRGLVCGVDHSDVMVRQATRRNRAAVRAGRVKLRLGSATDLPNYAAPFDKVLAVNSLMFWDDPVQRLRDLRSRLRAGGRIAIVYQPRGPEASGEVAERAAHEVTEQFKEAGFTDVRVERLDLKPTPAVCVLGENPG